VQNIPQQRVENLPSLFDLQSFPFTLQETRASPNPVGEGFPNRVSEFLLGKSRWRFK
jgi:hypothetical protein